MTMEYQDDFELTHNSLMTCSEMTVVDVLLKLRCASSGAKFCLWLSSKIKEAKHGADRIIFYHGHERIFFVVLLSTDRTCECIRIFPRKDIIFVLSEPTNNYTYPN